MALFAHRLHPAPLDLPRGAVGEVYPQTVRDVVRVSGHSRFKLPAEPCAHVVSCRSPRCSGHVTSSARRCPIVHASNPVLDVPVPAVAFRGIDVPVLGFHEDLYLRVIRPHVALSARLRMPCFRDRERMSGMARRAASHAPVRVDPPDAVVRPHQVVVGRLAGHVGAVA